MEIDTRPSLLFRLRDGDDAQAWAQFVAIYGPLVYHYARRRRLEHADAEDVTQSVFVKLLSGLRDFQYDSDRGRFRDWLGTIVRNEVLRWHRQTCNLPMTDSAAPDQLINGHDAEWHQEFHDCVLSNALTLCRPHFEDDTWAAFVSVWQRDESAAEVAKSLGKTIDFVYIAKSRVLKRLKATIVELTDDLPLNRD